MSSPVRRNTALLSASMAANSAMLQLNAAVSSLTLVAVVGVEELTGLGPALVLAAGAAAALPAGRAMDRIGRVPVLAAGFAAGAAGCLLVAAGSAFDVAGAVVLGLLGVGVAGGIALLARAAAADMYPPERRARGIGLVLFGAVFGAVLGPAVFSPLAAGREPDGDTLGALWSAGAGFALAGMVLVLAVRPDPSVIARSFPNPAAPAAMANGSLLELVRRPNVLPALLAAQASFGVMVGLMTLTGAVVVEHRHHPSEVVFPIIGAHVVGMYALVLVVGDVVDRVGRRRSLVAGLAVMAAAAVALGVVASVAATVVVLFALGLGWSLSFVAATAELADATEPAERGRLLGLNDLLSGMTGAVLVVAGGAALSAFGVAALTAAATALVAAPAFWILVRPRPA